MEDPVATGPEDRWPRFWDDDMAILWGFNGYSMGKPSVFIQVDGNLGGYQLDLMFAIV